MPRAGHKKPEKPLPDGVYSEGQKMLIRDYLSDEIQRLQNQIMEYKNVPKKLQNRQWANQVAYWDNARAYLQWCYYRLRPREG